MRNVGDSNSFRLAQLLDSPGRPCAEHDSGVDEPTRLWARAESVTVAAVPRPQLAPDEPTVRYRPGAANDAALFDAVNTEITQLPRASDAFQLLQQMRQTAGTRTNVAHVPAIRTPLPMVAPPKSEVVRRADPPFSEALPIAPPVPSTFDLSAPTDIHIEVTDFRTRVAFTIAELFLLIVVCVAVGAVLAAAWFTY